jgi:hypothetical protein
MNMKTYQDNKNGGRTSPEFERELDFFIPVGVVLIEFEECSNEEKGMTTASTPYGKEVIEKWK